jgi:hypothetical protein
LTLSFWRIATARAPLLEQLELGATLAAGRCSRPSPSRSSAIPSPMTDVFLVFELKPSEVFNLQKKLTRDT